VKGQSWSEVGASHLNYLHFNLQLKHGFHTEEEKGQVLQQSFIYNKHRVW